MSESASGAAVADLRRRADAAVHELEASEADPSVEQYVDVVLRVTHSIQPRETL